MTGIYKITNKINGKCYIGQAVDINKRWNKHKTSPFNKNAIGYDYPLYRAIRKYGIDNFLFEVLEECSKEALNAREMFYIEKFDAFNNGYNQNKGGQDGSASCKLTENDVDQIINRLKTTIDGPKAIAKEYGVGPTTIHNINVGDAYRRENETYPIRPRLYTLMVDESGQFAQKAKGNYCKICGKQICHESTHCIDCMGIANRKVMQRPQPLDLARMIKEFGFEEVGRRLGVSGKTISKWCKQYNIPNTKSALIDWYNNILGITQPPPKIKKKISEIVRPVHQICKTTGKIISTFSSQSEAMRYLGISNKSNHITQVCRGMRQSAYGYYWQYAD